MKFDFFSSCIYLHFKNGGILGCYFKIYVNPITSPHLWIRSTAVKTLIENMPIESIPRKHKLWIKERNQNVLFIYQSVVIAQAKAV